MTFRRTALAQEMARQLLRPTFLDTSLRSGLFLSGERRVGKSTLLTTELIPALQDLGAIVIYVDLWRHPQVLECAANPRFGDAPGTETETEIDCQFSV